MKIYFANGLFSQADRDFNEKVVNEIRNIFPEIKVYLPQENIGINDKTKVVTSVDIATADNNEISKSDLLIAVLDNEDPGVMCEIGIAYKAGMTVIGLCTDIRFNNENLEGKANLINNDVFENPIMYNNLFVTGIIKKSGGTIYNDPNDLIDKIKSLGEHNG